MRSCGSPNLDHQAMIGSLEPQRRSTLEVGGGVGLVAELPDGAAKREHVKVFVGANDGTW